MQIKNRQTGRNDSDEIHNNLNEVAKLLAFQDIITNKLGTIISGEFVNFTTGRRLAEISITIKLIKLLIRNQRKPQSNIRLDKRKDNESFPKVVTRM